MIVGVGELLWDVFPDCRKVAGGAPFNFAFHCHNLGHEAAVVSRVGDDDLGRELRAEVRRLGLSDEFIQTDPAHPTGTVQVTVDPAGQPSYEIVQNVAWDHIEWTPELEQLAWHCRAVCFGTVSQRGDENGRVIRKFTSGDQSVTPLSPRRVCDLNLRLSEVTSELVKRSIGQCDFLKVNDDELIRIAELLGLVRRDDTSAAIDLANRNPCPLVCVTRGEHGAFLAWSGGDISEPGVPAAVVDTVGAGDSFTAAMVCLHLEGRSLKDCARFANHYAARVCEYRGGTPPIDRAEVERAAFG